MEANSWFYHFSDFCRLHFSLILWGFLNSKLKCNELRVIEYLQEHASVLKLMLAEMKKNNVSIYYSLYVGIVLNTQA